MPLAMLPDGPVESTRLRKDRLVVYTVDLGHRSPTHPFSRELFILREDAEHFIDEMRGDDPELAETLRIEARVLEAGGRN